MALARSERTTLERSLTQTRDRLSAAMAEAQGWDQRAGQAAGRIAEMDDRAATLDRDAAALADQPSLLADEIARLATAHDTAKAEAERTQIEEADAERALRAIEAAHAETQCAVVRRAGGARGGTGAGRESRTAPGRTGPRIGRTLRLPRAGAAEKLAFDSASVGSPQTEAAAHDKLSADRERIGPVNLVAEQELADLEASGAAVPPSVRIWCRRWHGCAARSAAQPRGAAAAAGGVRGGERPFPDLVRDAVRRRLGASGTDRFGRSAGGGLEIMAQPPGKRLQSLTLLSGANRP